MNRLAAQPLGLVFVSSRDPLPPRRGTLEFAVDKPSAIDQKTLWQTALGPSAASLNGALDSVSTQFRLSAETIVRTGETLRGTLAAAPPRLERCGEPAGAPCGPAGTSSLNA